MHFPSQVRFFIVWKNNPEMVYPSQDSTILGRMTSTDRTTVSLSHDPLNKMMPAGMFSSM